MTPQRRGAILLELLVALPLVALLSAVAVHLLLNTHRTAVSTDGALGATRELRHGANVLASEWRGLRPSDLVAWSDTSIELQATVGVGVVCSSQTTRNSVALIGSDPAGAQAVGAPQHLLQPGWNQSLQPGDLAEVWLAPSTVLDAPNSITVRVQNSVPSAACNNASSNRTAALPTLQLTLYDSLPSQLVVGAPVRVFRRVRYSLYRSSDGDWYLGRKTFTTSGWDVVQPVAGPLHSARDHGLEFRILDRNNAPLISGQTPPPSPPSLSAARIHVRLLAPQRAGRASPAVGGTDSISIDIALPPDSTGTS